MTTTEPRVAEVPARPERSVPKPQFTDAEAGAKEFPDSDAAARHFNYYKPAKRKQTHYEDVTVEVQPDPRHYLSQGWIYGFADGSDSAGTNLRPGSCSSSFASSSSKHRSRRVRAP